MTVKELREKLANYPDDAKVYLFGHYGYGAYINVATSPDSRVTLWETDDA